MPFAASSVEGYAVFCRGLRCAKMRKRPACRCAVKPHPCRCAIKQAPAAALSTKPLSLRCQLDHCAPLRCKPSPPRCATSQPLSAALQTLQLVTSRPESYQQHPTPHMGQMTSHTHPYQQSLPKC